jgi:hypothetical protein
MHIFKLTSIYILVLTGNLFSAPKQIEGLPELQKESIGEESIYYYYKFEMGKERIALLASDLKILVYSKEFGEILTLSHFPCRFDDSTKNEQSIKNITSKVSKSNILLDYEIHDHYYSGKGEIKELSSEKEQVGKGSFSVTIKPTSIKYENRVFATKKHAVRSYYSFYLLGVPKTEEEKNYHIFAKNHRRTTAELVPYKGRSLTFNVYDKQKVYDKKLEYYGNIKEGGWRELSFKNRLGCKEITLKNTSKFTHFSIESGYNFTAYSNQKFRNMMDLENNPYYESFKYKTKSSSRSKKMLLAGKTFKHSGYISIK